MLSPPFISCNAIAQPLENSNNLAARLGVFFDSLAGFSLFWCVPASHFLSAVHCLNASLSCSTLAFSSTSSLSNSSSLVLSKVFSKLWLSIRRCCTSLYFSPRRRWCEAACTPWSPVAWELKGLITVWARRDFSRERSNARTLLLFKVQKRCR